MGRWADDADAAAEFVGYEKEVGRNGTAVAFGIDEVEVGVGADGDDEMDDGNDDDVAVDGDFVAGEAENDSYLPTPILHWHPSLHKVAVEARLARCFDLSCKESLHLYSRLVVSEKEYIEESPWKKISTKKNSIIKKFNFESCFGCFPRHSPRGKSSKRKLHQIIGDWMQCRY